MNFLLRLFLPVFVPGRQSWMSFLRSMATLVSVLIVAFSLDAQSAAQEPVVVHTDKGYRDGLFLSWPAITALLMGLGMAFGGLALYVRSTVNNALLAAFERFDDIADERYVRKEVFELQVGGVHSKLNRIESKLESRLDRYGKDIRELTKKKLHRHENPRDPDMST